MVIITLVSTAAVNLPLAVFTKTSRKRINKRVEKVKTVCQCSGKGKKGESQSVSQSLTD